MENRVIALMNGSGSVGNFLELLMLFVVFILILIATYYTTKWVGNVSMNRYANKNIQIIETYRLAPGKFIQIIRIANQYLAVAISKDTVTYLATLDEEQLSMFEKENTDVKAFKDVLSGFMKKN